jgi:site-specific DNA-cytosine methylase
MLARLLSASWMLRMASWKRASRTGSPTSRAIDFRVCGAKRRPAALPWDDDRVLGPARRALPLCPAQGGKCRSTGGALGSRQIQGGRFKGLKNPKVSKALKSINASALAQAKPNAKAKPATKAKTASESKPASKAKSVSRAKQATKPRAVTKPKRATQAEAAGKRTAKPASKAKAASKAKPASRAKAKPRRKPGRQSPSVAGWPSSTSSMVASRPSARRSLTS